MLNPEEFKNKLEKIKKGTANSNPTAELEDEVYVIPEEYRGHYSGVFGECDYDARMFEIREDTFCHMEILHYREDCGLAPIIPLGYRSCCSMFCECENLKSVDLSKLDTSKVTDMSRMFAHCVDLVSLDLSRLDTSNVLSMEMMFFCCEHLDEVDISNFNMAMVKNTRGMFAGCKNLVFLDLSGLDMANVTDMRMMFTNCCRLKGVKVSNLSVSQVRDGTMAFYDCNSLTGRCRTELRDFGFDL